jgi:hypothetical protein
LIVAALPFQHSILYDKEKELRDFDESVFLQRICDTNLWDVYQTTDIDEAVELFTNKINLILDQLAPMKTFQTSLKYCPWLSEETKLLINEKNKAQNTLSENKNDENFEVFRN